jgi:hypothetical protein
LAGEAEGLTRKAVEVAFAGDPMALRLCVELLLPVCRERAVEFKLPPIESPANIAAAMKALTSALAQGETTPGEAGRIAGVVDTFVRAIETSEFERRLQELEATVNAPDAASARRRAGPALQSVRVISLLICCRLQGSLIIDATFDCSPWLSARRPGPYLGVCEDRAAIRSCVP